MSKKLYVGNLSFDTTENDLDALFAEVGEVESVRIITDRDTGRSRGFGFVEMSDEAGDKAISQFDGKELAGRALTVNEARPQVDRNRGGGGSGGSGGGGGRGGRRDFGGRY
jgi:RNA recognition motif-containing protein